MRYQQLESYIGKESIKVALTILFTHRIKSRVIVYNSLSNEQTRIWKLTIYLVYNKKTDFNFLRLV